MNPKTIKHEAIIDTLLEGRDFKAHTDKIQAIETQISRRAFPYVITVVAVVFLLMMVLKFNLTVYSWIEATIIDSPALRSSALLINSFPKFFRDFLNSTLISIILLALISYVPVIFVLDKETRKKDFSKLYAWLALLACFVLIPVFLVLTTFLLALYFPNSHSSWIFSSPLYIAAIMLISQPIIFIGLLMEKIIYESLARKMYFDSYVVGNLVYALDLILENEAWFSLRHRKKIAVRISNVAHCFEDSSISNFEGGSYEMKIIYRKKAQNMADGFRCLNLWLFTPKTDTRKVLKDKLVASLRSFMDADLDALAEEGHLVDYDLSRKDFIVGRVERFLSLTFRVILPFLILWLLQFTSLRLEGKFADYLTVGAFIFSAITVFLELDPNFKDKLDVLQQIKVLLSRDN